jgi:hypothetical protein
MKTLPDSPSLDHLRRQAKDVLQQLRAVRPGASLSDAQTAVAEQYGYRTWPDLKAEVERRCASVRTADGGFVAAVAEAFALGTPTGPLVAQERQWAGHAWLLTTNKGRWVARQLFGWFDEGAVDSEVLLAETAVAAGIRTPRPVRTAGGAVVATVSGDRWRVFEFLTMGPEPSTPANPRHAAAAGRILGKVHQFGLPAPEPVQPWLTSVLPESSWWKLHELCAARGMPWADRLAEVIPGIVDSTRIIEPVDPAEPVVLSACHYAPNAFRVAGPDDLVVTGWDHAGSIRPRWDLGGTLSGWSGGAAEEVNGATVRALLSGYAEEATVPEPLDLGIFSAALSASLNWLVSRIRIAINPSEPAEEREIAGRAVPWLLAHPPSRDRFEAILHANG